MFDNCEFQRSGWFAERVPRRARLWMLTIILLRFGSGAASAQTFIYEINGYYPSIIRGFLADPMTGGLTATPIPSFAAPGNLGQAVADIAGRFLFMTSQRNCPYANATAQISSFVIDPSTGILSGIKSVNVPCDGNNPIPSGIAVEASGRYLYVAFDQSRYPGPASYIQPYSIGQNGDLSPIGSPTSVPSQPAGIMVDPTGIHLYAALSGDSSGDPSTEGIAGFTIDATTGALAPIQGSPFFASNSTHRCAPSPLAMDSQGQLVYARSCTIVNNSLTNYALATLRVDPATGALTEVPNSPLSLPSWIGSPSVIVPVPSANLIYTASFPPSAFSVDRGTGALAVNSSSQSQVANGLYTLSVDPSGRFLYGSNTQVASLYGFGIGATGDLTPLPGSPFAGDIDPVSVVVAKIGGQQLVLSTYQGGSGGNVTVNVYGNNLSDGDSVRLVCPGQPDIVATSTVINALGTILTTSFDLTTAKPGSCTVVLTEPDGKAESVLHPFTIEQTAAANIWTDVVGRNVLRAGDFQTNYIVVGNSGNADADTAAIWVSFPSFLSWNAVAPFQPSDFFQVGTNTTLFYQIGGKIPAGGTQIVSFGLYAPDDQQHGHYKFNIQVTGVQ